MVALARLLFIGSIVLTIIYFCLTLYARALRHDKLEAKWNANGGPGDRESFVSAGLQEYAIQLRRKLVIGVYVLPTLGVAALIYFTNFA